MLCSFLSIRWKVVPFDLWRILVVCVTVFMTTPAFACNASNPLVQINFPPVATTWSRDNFRIGQMVADSSSATTTFNGTGCSTITVSPPTAPIPGVTSDGPGGTYAVYPTGIPGIGYTIGIMLSGSSRWTPVNTLPTNIPVAQPMQGTGFAAQVYYVYTATTMQSGIYSIPRQFIAVSAPNLNSNIIFGGFTLTLKSTTCSLTTASNMTVPLPTVAPTSFTGVGSVSTESASFSMGLSCPTLTNIYATMTDATNPANTGNALSLVGGSDSASGVGIALYYQGNRVSFGADSSEKGNPNQFYIGLSNASYLSAQFTARYVQTAKAVLPGSVNALSTITFSYQ